jgi:hypothetical protein
MHKSATKCNETIGKWCKNKHGASKIIDTFETYQWRREEAEAATMAKRVAAVSARKEMTSEPSQLHVFIDLGDDSPSTNGGAGH